VFLFHQKTLNKELLTFNFPPDLKGRHQLVLQWIQTLDQGTLDQVKEVSLHGQFFQDFFQSILGYRSVIEGAGKTWEIHSESTISDGGGVADGAIGFFNAIENDKGKVKLQGKIIAPIELKGSKTDLDRPLSGKKETPVDQGWRYANYTPNCQWVIVSNYREIRLYQLSKTPAYYEQFFLKDLADIENFKRFYFIFCRQNFLASSSNATSRIDNLFDQSNDEEKSITEKLYQNYRRLRIDLLDHFRRNSPSSVPNWDMILIEKAQKTLDRLLFIAFCEDRRLLPDKTIRKAHDFSDPYYPRPIWHNYKRVFQWVDQGNEDPPISGYNGGLFKHDALLDEVLNVPNSLCSEMNQLTRFDFETEVSVDILGRIFEQSVTDLEELRAVAKGEKYDEKKGKRKTQGVFYTPAFITQYIVQRALGKYLDQKEQELREQSFQGVPNSQQEILFWKTYRDNILQKTKIIDPSCGSGAFLIAAYNYLLRQYERVNLALASFNETPLNRTEINQIILKKNLYGVDLSPESVEITKLSLWLQTAEMGKQLTDLENNIKAGNSIIDDAQVHSLAFNWQAAFPEVFSQGGFDVVIGNPPYVRQELLSPYKSYLQANYDSYDGVADLYTYFYEKGLKILKPDGILSYIVTNKWLRSGYGEALRKFFVENTIVDQIVDFGHAPIFEDADTFPCIIVAKKVLKEAVIPKESPVLICPVPRNKLKDINLSQYVDQEGFSVEWSRFSEQAWSLESPQVDLLMQKIKNMGIPLKEFTGVKPLLGIKTGFNQAFLIDENTKNKLVQTDPKCAEIIKPYLRGQDIKRWSPEWQNLWIILIKSSSDYTWDWSNNKENAEIIFKNKYPSIYVHLKSFEEKLCKRQDKGRYWWELRPCAYYEAFQQPKYLIQGIAFHSRISFDSSGTFINNAGFILPSSDLWILAVLNSPILWSFIFRNLPHKKDEAIAMDAVYVESLPIAPPTDEIRSQVEPILTRLIELTKANQQTYRDISDWLKSEQNIDKLGQKLEKFNQLAQEEFIKEIKKRKPKSEQSLNVTALRAVKEVYNEYTPIINTRQIEAKKLEQCLSDLVNQAYGSSGFTVKDV
jgi:hypothetical protein